MDFDKLIKKAAKSYKNGDADKVFNQASKTANRMFDELAPKAAKQNDLVKELRKVADDILTDSKSTNSGNHSDSPIVQSIKQGLKSARKTADHYADKIDSDNTGKSAAQAADIASDLLGSAEKLGKSFFSKPRK